MKQFRDIGYRLILASQSPRRKELLAGLDLEFEVAQAYEVDETPPVGVDAEEVAAYLSLKKSLEFPFELKSNDIVISSDTVVCIDNKPLGKPTSRQDAISMLTLLSGKEHSVVTAVTLRVGNIAETFSQITLVKFKSLSEQDIHYYVDNYQPYDKAGAYAIQEWIGYVAIESISGSFYNVMGLPVCKLNEELTKFINKLNLINKK